MSEANENATDTSECITGYPEKYITVDDQSGYEYDHNLKED